jgi:hypothetical protein
MKLQVLTKALHGVENPKSQFPVTGSFQVQAF